MPALVSDLGAPADRVRRNGGGRAITVGDVDAWAQAIEEIASHPEQLTTWRQELTLPSRLEEEAFFYESLYRRMILPAWSCSKRSGLPAASKAAMRRPALSYS